jgi:hypothetical protein
MTVQREVADISKEILTQLSEIIIKCLHYSLYVDDSMDITSTAQMCRKRYNSITVAHCCQSMNFSNGLCSCSAILKRVLLKDCNSNYNEG